MEGSFVGNVNKVAGNIEDVENYFEAMQSLEKFQGRFVSGSSVATPPESWYYNGKVYYCILQTSNSPDEDQSAWVEAPFAPQFDTGPALATDMDLISENGSYYTDATTENRISIDGLGIIDVIFDHDSIDESTAVQRAVGYLNNTLLFRGKSGGVWGPWMRVTCDSLSGGVVSSGWPELLDDNVIYEVPTSVTTGWTEVAGGTVTSDGSVLTFEADGTAYNYEHSAAVFTGDYIEYVKISAAMISGSYTQFTLGSSGDGVLSLQLGYNWETLSAELGRVSVSINGTGVAGPVLDYEASAVEVALQHDSRVGATNLFIKESGAWVFYGAAAASDPYRTTIRVSMGGDKTSSGYVHEWFFAKPNIVAIGDSVTAGHNSFDPAPDYYAGDDDYDSTWMSHAGIYSGIRNNLIVNYGVGGETSAQVNSRISAMLSAATPRVVFLSACNNDYGASIDYGVRTSNIQDSVDKIVASGASAVLYNAVYPNNSTDSRDYYKGWWEANAASISGVSLAIDIMQSGVLDVNDQINSIYAVDHVHPNVAGYTIIGEYIAAQEP